MDNSKMINNVSKDVVIDTPTDYPDAKWHQYVSFIKSGIRIVGYAALPFNINLAVGILIVSELVGIIEELV
jgi:hypothetical protein